MQNNLLGKRVNKLVNRAIYRIVVGIDEYVYNHRYDFNLTNAEYCVRVAICRLKLA
ncbi:hypothetical protein SFSGTM_03180 [Sulfuriferula nivalis]|uniref:Uncharacterized protein n=1 Tax=Sulfuriferula nivalis TaxID=2675298 RepID=A0A809SG46_9PROT|nr:hypothetical protein SFSGTM_03180 [Sulfuriferula nivalis]